jgi:hypothetical protein
MMAGQSSLLTALRSPGQPSGMMVPCPWKRRLSDDQRSVLLSELLLRHPELVAEAEEIISALLVVETIRILPTRSQPGCGRCALTGRCPSIRDGDGS